MVQEYDRFGLPVLTPKDVRQMKTEIKRKRSELEEKLVSPRKRSFLQIVRGAFTPIRN